MAGRRRQTRRRRSPRPTDGLGWLFGGLARLLYLPIRLIFLLLAAVLRALLGLIGVARTQPVPGMPAGWLALSPTQFEEAVAQLLRAQGYRDVRRVGGAGDLGVDILARDPQGRPTAVQCKRYAPGSRTGSQEIQTFIGMAFVHHRAERAIFVTTSDFTAQARALARQHAIQLVDGSELARLWNRSLGSRAPSWRLVAGVVVAGLVVLGVVAALVGGLGRPEAPPSPTPRATRVTGTVGDSVTATATPDAPVRAATRSLQIAVAPTISPRPDRLATAAPTRTMTPTPAPVVGLAAEDEGAPPAATNPAGVPERAVRSSVLSVVDGDTITVLLNGSVEPVRFVGIDAPETRHPTTPAECFGAEATARATALLPVGQPIYLERDVSDRDQYDRLLRHVWLPAVGGGEPVLVGEVLVREGYAVAGSYPPDLGYAGRLRAAERAARAGEVGLWGACGGAAPAPIQPVAACDPSYPDVCIPPPPPDLDCPEVGYAGFRVVGADPHRLDRDRDGIGCE